MTSLPPDLVPWARELEPLPLDLARALGPWLKRLSVAVGPMRQRMAGTSGDVDGFQGIGRRGNVEHLLMSDWLLAEELPDEFLRRAVARELSYLQLERREPAGARTSIALFDSGPDQVGAPRLAHIALAVVLARRAAAAEADFAWGLLQRADDGLCERVDEVGIKRLLLGRTHQGLSPGQIEEWADRLAQLEASDEVWMIGAAGASYPSEEDSPVSVRRRLFPRASLIEIEDRTGVHGLSIAVRRADSAPAVEVDLDLPTEAASIRLLRDPFRSAAVAAASTQGIGSGVKGLVLASNRRRVIVACSDGSVVLAPIPNSPRQMAGKPVVVPGDPDEVLVGVQYAKRRGFVLTTDGTRLRLRSRSRTVDFTLPVGWQPPEPDQTLRPCWHQRRGSTFCLCLLDGAGTLYRLVWSRPGAQPELVHRQVLDAALIDGMLYCLLLRDGVVECVGSHSGGDLQYRHGFALDRTLDPGEVLLGKGKFGVALAYRNSERQWRMLQSGLRADRYVELPGGCSVHGLMAWAGYLYLLVLEADGRTIQLASFETQYAVDRITVEDPVVQLCCSIFDPTLAYATASGEVKVLRLQRDAGGGTLLHLTPEPA